MHHAVNAVFVESHITYLSPFNFFMFKNGTEDLQIPLDTEMEHNVTDQENSKNDADCV